MSFLEELQKNKSLKHVALPVVKNHLVDEAYWALRSEISEIEDNLLLTSAVSAKDQDQLLALGVTHVLCCADIPPVHPDSFVYRCLDLLDVEEQNISDHLTPTCGWIENVLQNETNKLLVHCVAGVSRSASFVIAYLMQRDAKPYLEVLQYVQSKRSIVCPNPGFEKQLQKFGNVCWWDFDHTIIGDNSDTWIVEQLEPELAREFRERPPEQCWTDLMDSLCSRLGSVERIKKKLAELVISEQMKRAITACSEAGYTNRIISDANTLFIETVLQANDMAHHFDIVISNPSRVDAEGRLRVSYLHEDPHGCSKCPRNMCKGKEVRRCALYVGDGRGDVCPSLLSDVVLARHEWPLHKQMLQEPAFAGQLHTWSSHAELADIMQDMPVL